MSSFAADENAMFATWSSADIDILEGIDGYFNEGICNLLKYLVSVDCRLTNQKVDLTVVLYSAVNSGKFKYSFDDVERIITLSSEFCLIDCLYQKQVLYDVALVDNGALFLALHGYDSEVLNAALFLSTKSLSIFYPPITRPSLSLFGVWYDYGVALTEALLTKASFSDNIDSLIHTGRNQSLAKVEDFEFNDILYKLERIGLLTITRNVSQGTIVKLVPEAAVLLLVFSSNKSIEAFSDSF